MSFYEHEPTQLYLRVEKDGELLFEKTFHHSPITVGADEECDVYLPNFPGLDNQTLIYHLTESGWQLKDPRKVENICVDNEHTLHVWEGLTILSGKSESFEWSGVVPYPMQPNVPLPKSSPPKIQEVQRPTQTITVVDRLKLQCVCAKLLWRGVVLETQVLRPSQSVILGPEGFAVPWVKKPFSLGLHKGDRFLYREYNSPRSPVHVLKRGESARLPLDHDLEIHVEFIETPRALQKKSCNSPHPSLKFSTLFSAVIHSLFLSAVYMTTKFDHPPSNPRIEAKYAKLILTKPDPAPPQVVEHIVEPPPPQRPNPRPTLTRKSRPQPRKVVVQVPKTVSTHLKPPRLNHAIAKALGPLPPPSFLLKPAMSPLNKAQTQDLNRNPTSVHELDVSPNYRGGDRSASLSQARLDTYQLGRIQSMAGQRNVAGKSLSAPSLLLGAPSPKGLSDAQVMQEVSRHLSKIQACYESALASQPQLSGRIGYEWLITPKGRVSWVRVKTSEIASADGLNHCVLQIFKAMRFPAARNGETTQPTIGFPFGKL